MIELLQTASHSFLHPSSLHQFIHPFLISYFSSLSLLHQHARTRTVLHCSHFFQKHSPAPHTQRLSISGVIESLISLTLQVSPSLSFQRLSQSIRKDKPHIPLTYTSFSYPRLHHTSHLHLASLLTSSHFTFTHGHKRSYQVITTSSIHPILHPPPSCLSSLLRCRQFMRPHGSLSALLARR